VYDAQFATHAKTLWNSPAVKSIWQEQKEFISLGPMDFFFDKLDEICTENFTPSEDDILRCRQRTLGASSNLIYTNEKLYWEFIDVGGQQPEREKWEKVMENNVLNGIIYFVAADEFDTIDPTLGVAMITKIELSKMIWRDLYKKVQADLKTVSVMLFFNKVDVFTEYIKDKKRGLKRFKRDIQIIKEKKILKKRFNT